MPARWSASPRPKESHPQVMAVFAAGGVSQDQAAIATKAPAYLDRWFAEVATVATVAQLRVMVRAARPAPKPASGRRADRVGGGLVRR